MSIGTNTDSIAKAAAELDKQMTLIGFTPFEDFDHDHWQLVLYIETRCVDYGGVSGRFREVDHLSTFEKHEVLPELNVRGIVSIKAIEDGEEYAEAFELSNLGWSIAHQLRRNRAAKIKDADFDVKPFIPAYQARLIEMVKALQNLASKDEVG